MQIGVIVQSGEAETVWNAWRFALHARTHGNRVRVFLLGHGVECQRLSSPSFNIEAQMSAFVAAGGEIQACGSCLDRRGQDPHALVPVSGMNDLYALVREADRMVTF